MGWRIVDSTGRVKGETGGGWQVINSTGYGKQDVLASEAGGLTLATEQATTSGTSIDFTGIPAGTKFIIVMFAEVSTNGTSPLLLQLGDAGGFETAGYTGRSTLINGAAQTANGAGFRISEQNAAGATHHGSAFLTLEDSTGFTWMELGQVSDEVSIGQTSSVGAKSLSAELTQVRITTVNGTDAFDAGAVNISYMS